MLRAHIPRGTERRYRRYFRHIQQALDSMTMASPQLGVYSTDNNSGGGTSKPGSDQSAGVRVIEVDGGALPPLGPGTKGELLTFRFLGPGIVQAGNEVKLRGDFPHPAGGMLVLCYDGKQWVEQGRTGGDAPVLNAAEFGLSAWRSNNEGPLQAAVDVLQQGNNDRGGVIFVPASQIGAYAVSAPVLVKGKNVSIVLESGATLSSTVNNVVLNVQGTKSATATATVTATAAPFSLTLSVAAGDEAKFTADDWVFIEDDEAPSTGSSIKGEVNRIKSTSSGVLTLYYPTVNNYNTATRTVTVLDDCPVNFRLEGGVITNYPAVGSGSSGLRIQYAFAPIVRNVQFISCRTEGIKIRETRFGLVDGCAFRDQPEFDGSVGYGVTTSTSTGIIISNCHFERVRHGADFSYWSTSCLAVGCTTYATALGAMQIHPDTQGCAFIGNTIDGACGQDDSTASGYNLVNTVGGGNSLASAIVVREYSDHALVANNIIRNVSASGVFISAHATYAHILGNKMYNVNAAASAFGGIIAAGGNGGWHTIQGNYIHTARYYGINCAAPYCTIKDNHIENVTLETSYGHGIFIPYDTTNSTQIESTLIQGNRLVNIGGSGIYLGKAGGLVNDTVIDGNYFTDIDQSGVYILSTVVTDVTIKNNYFTGCNNGNSSSHGAIVDQTTSTNDRGSRIFMNNIIEGQCRYGIIATLDNTVIMNNVFMNVTGTTSIGIAVYVPPIGGASNDTDGMAIIGNFFFNADTYGILLGSSTGNNQNNTLLMHNVFIGCDTYDIYNRQSAVGTIFLGNYGDGTIQDDGTTPVHLLHYDGTNKRVGIGTLTPASPLDVNLEARMRSVILDGDPSSGVSSTNILTGATDTPTTDPASAMGEVYFVGNSTATVITTSAAYTLVAPTATTLGLGMDFDMPANGRLRYTGARTRKFHMGCTLSMAGVGANDVMKAVLYKNGTVNGNNEFTGGTALTGGTIERKMGAAGDVGSTAIHVMTELATNDYIELGISNETDTDNVTVKHMNLFAVAMWAEPDGYIKGYVGTQAVAIPYYNT